MEGRDSKLPKGEWNGYGVVVMGRGKRLTDKTELRLVIPRIYTLSHAYARVHTHPCT